MWTLGPGWHDEAALARQWRESTPFAHVIIDDCVDDLDPLLAILDEEPVQLYEADLYRFDATAPEPETAELRALRDSFTATLAPLVSRITGKHVTRADLRAYAYRPGHYLLPHTDHQADLARQLAFAYYLPSPEPPVGGELELYRGDDSAQLIEPRANRMVLFDVGDASLHEVREVLRGLRLSFAGWFYP